MTIDELIEERPVFQMGHKEHIDWGVTAPVLKWICDNVEAGAQTLETGSGLSTCAFVLAGAYHLSIDPRAGQRKEIRDWLKEKGVDVDHWTARVGYSELELPDLLQSGYENLLDVAFLDGNHAFPIPMVDWCYVSRMLKVGGLLLIDDFKFCGPLVLYNFMAADPDWEKPYRITNRVAVFKKIAAGGEKKWHFEQPWSLADIERKKAEHAKS